MISGWAGDFGPFFGTPTPQMQWQDLSNLGPGAQSEA